MPRRIISVGIQIPGESVEMVELTSRQSLLDADIIVFSPSLPHGWYPENYQGKPCLTDDGSFQAREAVAHWRRELKTAVEAGKLVVVLLQRPDEVFAATGEKQFSGTGRNARTTRVVASLNAYEALPLSCPYHVASGSDMILDGKARFFAPYWSELEKYSRYEVYLEWESADILIKTRSGNRVVGACVRKGKGAILLVPNLNFDKYVFTEKRTVRGKESAYWTKIAKNFEHTFTSVLVSLADTLAAEVSATPPPDWVQKDIFRLSEEAIVENEIKAISSEIAGLEERRSLSATKLKKAGELRGLLFEQGKMLEHAVLAALNLFGFSAEGYEKDGSEFDVVFTSEEGRFVGEVEGKDHKAIAIDKFSQLERNLSEDFARDDITEHAKGVLFGNAFRLQPTANRGKSFTDKCEAAALRLQVALVHTPDLFEPARYLKSTVDVDYAKKCRAAIFEAKGNVATFPVPPSISKAVSTTAEVVQGD